MKHSTKKIRIIAAVLMAFIVMSLMPVSAFAESYSAVVTEKSIKVYNDPALTDNAGVLNRGAVVVVEEVNGKTAMISYKGVSGYYCSISALTDVLEVGMPVIVNTDTRAYEKPDTESAFIDVERGTELTLLAVDDKWALVEGNGYGVYIKKAHLSLIDEELSTPAPKPTQNTDISGSIDCTVTASSLNVYESTSTASKKLIVLEYGDRVQVIAYNSNWAYLYYDGVYGYCSTSGLLKTSLMPTVQPEELPGEEIFEAVVTTDSQAYESASTSAKKLAKLPEGTVVNVLAYNSTWAKVEKNGSVGYVKTSTLTRADDNSSNDGDELTSVSSFSAIAINKAQVYSEASASSEKKSTLSAGTVVTVLAYNSTWARIQYNDSVGYVKTPNLVKYSLKSCNSYKALTTDRVQAYSAPTTSSAKLAVLPVDTEVTVTACDSTWAKVEKNGSVGYVKLSYIKKKPAKNLAEEYREKYPTVQFTATIIADSVPGYYDSDTSSADFNLDMGQQVDVYGYSRSWAYIGIGDRRGFVATKYISSADYTELSSGSNGENTKKLQQNLLKLGYYDGIPDGNYSNLTTSAVRRFQSAAGLESTGKADVVTLRVLYGGYAPASSLLSAKLSSGDSNESVNRIQTRLYYLEYFSRAASIDGSYGSTTIAGIKLFQGVSGLPVTGVADAATIKALYAADALVMPRGNVAVDYVAGTSNDAVLQIPKGLESTQSYLPANPTDDERIEYAIYIGQLQLGKPYIYGTAGPNSFDCSGFTTYCFKKVNVSLGRSAYAQGYNSSSGTKITNISDLKRGDIVCFETISDSDSSDHVGIYLGGGYFIHASSGSGNGRRVCISNMNSGFYQREFTWGRRPID